MLPFTEWSSLKLLYIFMLRAWKALPIKLGYHSVSADFLLAHSKYGQLLSTSLSIA